MPLTILCKACGTKNPLGKIYCQKCGETLDLEGLDKKIRAGITESVFKRFSRIVRSLIGFLLLAALAAVLVGLFLPVAMPQSGELSLQESKSVETKVDQVVAACLGRVRKPQDGYVFSQEELTYAANWLTGLLGAAEEDPGFALSPVSLAVEPLNDGTVRLILHSRVLKKLDVYSTLIGTITQKDGVYEFVTTAAKVGKIPLPGKAESVVEKRFGLLFSGLEKLETVSKNAAAVDVSDGKITVKVK